MARWEHRRRCAKALQCESDKRIEKANGAHRRQRAAGKTKERHPEEWRFNSPMGNPPGNKAGDESWGQDEEYRGADNCRETPAGHLCAVTVISIRAVPTSFDTPTVVRAG